MIKLDKKKQKFIWFVLCFGLPLLLVILKPGASFLSIAQFGAGAGIIYVLGKIFILGEGL